MQQATHTRTMNGKHRHSGTADLCPNTHVPLGAAAGDKGPEAAVNWLMEHEKDADIDQPMLVTMVGLLFWLSFAQDFGCRIIKIIIKSL